METKPLERFATWARRELITAVEAQATAVLSAGSVARTERATVIKTLENEINSHGREHVIDKVAYIWFNRIIALRFMDARNYTDAGVVSPPQGQTHGQPEILADAKRGNLDTDVFTSTRAADAIIGLLDGTRRSTDAEGEAYALLLTEYCRYWHKSMPFMFEREGDYTELLVPANLLADGAILSRAIEVLTEEVCDDVEVIGWLYQFYISERKDEVFAGFKKNKKAGAEEIPAATQLFTPHWIVRYLVENSLGRLWMLNRPSSSLVKQMDYYIVPVDEETDFLKISKPEELTVIDPACGSGHMITYAFDLLYAIYEEEGYAPSEIPGLILTNNLYGTEIDPRAGSLAAFALTMKARARQRTFFNKQVSPNICVLEPISFGPQELDFLATRNGDRYEESVFWNQFEHADTFGALIQADPSLTARLERHMETLDSGSDMLMAEMTDRARQAVLQAKYLTPRYTTVVANPPYMGSGNMNGALAAWLKSNYPSTRYDLMTAFMARAMTLCVEGGQLGMINLPSWMFLSSYASMRSELLQGGRIASMLHLGRGIFGSDFGSVAFIICNQAPTAKTRGIYRRLFDSSSEVRSNSVIEARFQERDRDLYDVRQEELESLPGTPVAYWLSAAMRKAFRAGQPMIDMAEPRQGLATADNGQFLRLWFEVSGDKFGRDQSQEQASSSQFKWFPYNKGGEYRKWYGNQDYVVNWEHDGREIRKFGTEGGGRPRSRAQNTQFYFNPAVSWSKVGIGIPAFRYFPGGFLFDVAGTSIFAGEESLLQLAAICNSNVVQAMLAATSSTLNVEVGTIAKLPIVDVSAAVTNAVSELIETHRDDWNGQETSWDFATLGLIAVQKSLVSEAVGTVLESGRLLSERVRHLETEMNAEIARLYGLAGEIDSDVPLNRVTLNANPEFRYGVGLTQAELDARFATDRVVDLISYSVGCMFGRYSLDEPGLILDDQSATLQDYLEKVPTQTFTPDADNVIPILADDRFEDDIVARFRQFLRVAFGQHHFEENLRFIEESLGVSDIRDYFIAKAGKSKFYDDHVQRYKKRPIYWMFSSPKGSFNALIYLHRYSASTVSTVLNEYLREYRGKLENALQNAERDAAGDASAKAQKEADRIRIILAELRDYEHDVLYPLATQQISIDLDDGVKANYPKLGPALKPIKGLELAG